jgi:hypothetical protein
MKPTCKNACYHNTLHQKNRKKQIGLIWNQVRLIVRLRFTI